jgi:2'-5' RNA ligase
VSEQLASWAREVSAALRGAAASAAADGAKLRLLAPETMHVTLCFLGSRPVAEIDVLAAALERCEAPPVGELSLGAPLWLPPRNPRSLALEIGDGDGWLERLQHALVEAIASSIAWEPDRRRFRAHVTVARSGRGKPSRAKPGRADGSRGPSAASGGHSATRDGDARGPFLPPTPQLSFTPRAVVLYRSWLDPQGASYEAVATRELTAASSDSPSSSPSSSTGEGEGGLP